MAESCGSKKTELTWSEYGVRNCSCMPCFNLNLYLLRESQLGKFDLFPAMPCVTFTHWHVEAARCNQSSLLSTARQQSHAPCSETTQVVDGGDGITSFSTPGQATLVIMLSRDVNKFGVIFILSFFLIIYLSHCMHNLNYFFLCSMSHWAIMACFCQLLFHFLIEKALHSS